MIPHNIARKLGALLLRHDELPAEVASGTVMRVDEDGVVWVQLYGAEDETPCETATVDVHEGDEVTVTIDGGSASIGGNVSRPATDDEVAQEARSLASSAATIAQAVSDELPKVRAVAVRVAEVAQGIAQEAQAIAEATNQHFFADGNGVHVTEVENDPTTEHNILINSLGILLRKATLPLVAISQSAIAFYDGVGNAASNIVARFGADGSQIGKSDESHVELDYHSMRMVDSDGDTYFYVSDLRDTSGLYETVDTFTGDGIKRLFALSYAASSNDYTVKVDGAEITSGVSKETYQVIFTTPPSDGAVVTVEYATTSERAKAYTLGFRASGSKVGPMSFAEGINVTASGQCSHAEGSYTQSTNEKSHAEGISTVASGLGAHSEGISTVASGSYSHAQNNHTIAAKHSQTALGTYNVEDTATTTTHPSGSAFYGKYAFIIGNGTASNRSNALTVDWSGNVEAAGTAKIASGGSKGLLTTDSTGFEYPLISDNGNNLWIGAHKAAEQHHTGGTFISAGAGRDSIYVSVPNSDNTGATNYPALHAGYPLTTTTTISDVISAQTNVTVSSASFSQWGKFCMLSVTYTLSSEISVPANGNTANTALFTIAAGKRPVEYLDVMLDVNVGAWGHITTGGVVSLDGANSRGAAWTLDTTTARYLRCCYLLP